MESLGEAAQKVIDATVKARDTYRCDKCPNRTTPDVARDRNYDCSCGGRFHSTEYFDPDKVK